MASLSINSPPTRPSSSDASSTTTDTATKGHKSRPCVLCGLQTSNSCSACKRATFCSVAHQRLSWPIHRHFCGDAAGKGEEDEFLLPTLTKREVELLQYYRVEKTHPVPSWRDLEANSHEMSLCSQFGTTLTVVSRALPPSVYTKILGPHMSFNRTLICTALDAYPSTASILARDALYRYGVAFRRWSYPHANSAPPETPKNEAAAAAGPPHWSTVAQEGRSSGWAWNVCSLAILIFALEERPCGCPEWTVLKPENWTLYGPSARLMKAFAYLCAIVGEHVLADEANRDPPRTVKIDRPIFDFLLSEIDAAVEEHVGMAAREKDRAGEAAWKKVEWARRVAKVARWNLVRVVCQKWEERGDIDAWFSRFMQALPVPCDDRRCSSQLK